MNSVDAKNLALSAFVSRPSVNQRRVAIEFQDSPGEKFLIPQAIERLRCSEPQLHSRIEIARRAGLEWAEQGGLKFRRAGYMTAVASGFNRPRPTPTVIAGKWRKRSEVAPLPERAVEPVLAAETRSRFASCVAEPINPRVIGGAAKVSASDVPPPEEFRDLYLQRKPEPERSLYIMNGLGGDESGRVPYHMSPVRRVL